MVVVVVVVALAEVQVTVYGGSFLRVEKNNYSEIFQ